MPWYLEVFKKMWNHVASPRNGRPMDRIAVLALSLIGAIGGYYLLIDTIAPSRNIVRRAWANLWSTPYQVFSGGKGGIYIEIGKVIEEATRGDVVVNNRILGEKESATDNVTRVLETPFSFGLCQEDVLIRAGVGPADLNIVGPIYDERMHILYRRSKFAALISNQEALGVPTSQTPVLAIDTNPVVRKFFAQAHIRTSSRATEAGKPEIASQLLNICGLQSNHRRIPGNFEHTINLLTTPPDAPDAVDIAFMMGGTPLDVLKNHRDLTTADGDLRLATVASIH